MAFLTRKQILEANDVKSEIVAVPEWGGEVMAYGLTGTERDQMTKLLMIQKGDSTELNLENHSAKLCSLAIRDEEGKRLFSEKDIEELGKKNGTALQRVFVVAQRLSGLDKETIEGMTKNSKQTQSGDSGSA